MIRSQFGKREWLSRVLFWGGLTRLSDILPHRSLLLVLNYHRIGNRDEDPYDPGVFSATADELDQQISFLKRKVSLVTLQEAMSFVDGTTKGAARRCHVLITFDDGYLDNYRVAYPILRAHGVQGVFFLATKLVGSSDIPWWDRIAYLMKTARRRQFHLSYPDNLFVDFDKYGMASSLREVLGLYKRPTNVDPTRFLCDLRDKTGGEDPPEGIRRFLNWTEAREMSRGGMAIGSHTHSHQVLTHLSCDEQRHELLLSRSLLTQHLNIDVEALAYPVGTTTSFSEVSKRLAQEVGFRAAFSFYGGTNLPAAMQRYDLRRVGVDEQSWHRFCVQATICQITGKHWP